MEGPELHVDDHLAGVALVPAAVELFRSVAELDDQIASARTFTLSLRRAQLVGPYGSRLSLNWRDGVQRLLPLA